MNKNKIPSIDLKNLEQLDPPNIFSFRFISTLRYKSTLTQGGYLTGIITQEELRSKPINIW